MMDNLRCHYCGQFIGYMDANARRYTPYGGYNDYEPPDEEFVCGKCWLSFDDKHISLIESISWQGPHLAFDLEAY